VGAGFLELLLQLAVGALELLELLSVLQLDLVLDWGLLFLIFFLHLFLNEHLLTLYGFLVVLLGSLLEAELLDLVGDLLRLAGGVVRVLTLMMLLVLVLDLALQGLVDDL